MTHFPEALRETASEVMVRLVAAAWIGGFFVLVLGALQKLAY